MEENYQKKSHDCAWCGMSEGKRGLIVGLAASVIVHFGILTTVALIATEPKPKPTTIDMGTYIIAIPHTTGHTAHKART